MPGRPWLLVDDDSNISMIVTILGRRSGLALTRRAEVESAWTALQAELPELVLLDLTLPGRSGLELLHRVRQEERTSGLAVALFSQSQLFPNIAAAWSAGANYLIAKDVVTNPDLWNGRIEEILAHLDGRVEPMSLSKAVGHGTVMSQSWGAIVNRALDHGRVAAQGSEVLEQVLHRALVRAFGRVPSGWLLPGIGRLEESVLPGQTSKDILGTFLSSVADQLWCLQGALARNAFLSELRR